MKKVLAVLLSVLLLTMMVPMGAVSVSAYTQGQDGLGPVCVEGGRRDFKWPVPGYYNLQSCFYDQRNHCALDISAPKNTAVIASYEGKVIKAVDGGTNYYGDGFGNYVVLQHSYRSLSGDITLYTRYSHLNSVSVREGTTVQAGVEVGRVGTTGYSEGDHLDFQILYGGWQPYQTYSIDPYANQLLELPENLAIYDSWNCGSTYYALVKELYATTNPSALIAQEYKSHCNIKITSDKTYVKSMPCSKDTDPNSVDVEVANKGDVYEVTMLCKNKWGKLWYEVKAKNGKTGYILSDFTQYLDQRFDDVGVKNPVSPTSIKKGNSFSIGGTIYATYQTITRVQSWVRSTDGSVDYLYGHADNLTTSSYNLSGSAVDNMMRFDNLKTGTYKYVVRICVNSYYVTDNGTVAMDYDDEFFLDACNSTFIVTDSSCSHYFYEYTTEPTCEDGGYTEYVCAYCGYAFTDDYTDPLGHDLVEIKVDPTCEEEGYRSFWCQRCNYRDYGDYVDATGHTLWQETIAATCQEYEKHIYHCENCTYSFEETTNIIGEHEYSFTDGYNPTCGEDGMVIFTCFVCGDRNIVTTPATGEHTYDNDCDDTCNACGEYREAASHNYVLESRTDATCEFYGVCVYVCSGCGIYYSETLPAIGHTYDDEYDATCNTCGATREVPDKPVDPSVPDLPADAPAFVVDNVTARAGEEFTVAIRTQRNSGIVSYKLKVAYDANVLELVSVVEKDFANLSFSPLTNNPFTINWVDAINPDNTTNGVVALVTFRVKEGAAIGQSPIILSYNPEDIYDQGFNNVAFRIENGSVTIVEFTPGDVNNDGKVNNKDLGLLQQYLNDWNVTVNDKAADTNGDGKVNNKDLGLLQQYLNDWNVELG